MDSVRIGMIGCGGMARAHLRQLSAIPEARVAALADPSGEQIAECVKQFPELSSVPVYADYREMLSKERLDAVEIGTPHTQHAAQILDSLAAGLHVLCEKPLVTSTADADTVIQALKDSGKVGLLSYQRHYQPEFRTLRERLQSREFGEVTFVSTILGQEWKRMTAGTWRQDPALSGGGQLNDSGSHFVDVLLWATGLTPETVVGFCDNRGAPVDIDSAAAIRFRGGALATITVMGDFPTWHEDWTICCERGGFLIREGKITLVQNDGSKTPAEPLEPGSDPDRNFVAAILRGEPVEANFEHGKSVIQLTEAVWQSSAKGGMPISL